MTPKEFASGKIVRNIELGNRIIYINFEDGTSCSAVWDGGRLNLMALNEKGVVIQLENK